MTFVTRLDTTIDQDLTALGDVLGEGPAYLVRILAVLRAVDADDAVAYFNRLDMEKIFVRSRSVIGRKVLMCHPAKSVDQVKRIVTGFKEGTLDKAEFWIDMGDAKIYIRYFPVKDDQGRYMGVLEVTQEIGALQKITGEKRLLD